MESDGQLAWREFVQVGAVVVKDVPPWTMVGGNPARRIKYIEESQ